MLVSSGWSAGCGLGFSDVSIFFKKQITCVIVANAQRPLISMQITKKKVSHKPTYENMRKSLEAMKTHCLNNGVTDISMPR